MTDKEQLKQLQHDYNAVLATPEGERLIYHIIAMCGVFNSSFTGNSETFFREGKRSIGLKVMSEIETHAQPKLANLLTMYANKK